jgi:hypothetical protein
VKNAGALYRIKTKEQNTKFVFDKAAFLPHEMLLIAELDHGQLFSASRNLLNILYLQKSGHIKNLKIMQLRISNTEQPLRATSLVFIKYRNLQTTVESTLGIC